ncbi:peptide chain release factor aRF-1 [Candidatus Micrarchaeota archaeon]|nr:peptide chain release factor aRF-1 [Candidatus Micrarchaeota archaeon]
MIDEKTYELKKQLKQLKKMKGRGTELISLYIPENYAISEITSKLRSESGQASNIKSKTTRKNVTDAITKILQYLKSFPNKPPKNGIAIFCGNVSGEEGKSDIKLFSIVPPEPIQVQLYRCDSSFFLEPLERQLGHEDKYGLLVMDGKEATFAYLKGTNVQILAQKRSFAHSKIRGGGQSAQRYSRLIENAIDKYYKDIGETMDRYFIKGVKGVIIGGPGPAKEGFLKKRPFNYQIKILGVVDIGYTDEYGIRELINKCDDIIAGQEMIKEKNIVHEFLRRVGKGSNLVTYGENEVIEAITTKRAEQVFVSEGLKRVIAYYNKPDSHSKIREPNERIKIIYNNDREVKEETERDGIRYKLDEKEDLIDYIIELCHENNIPVTIISMESDVGAQFYQSFYGIGAFLRY